MQLESAGVLDETLRYFGAKGVPELINFIRKVLAPSSNGEF